VRHCRTARTRRRPWRPWVVDKAAQAAIGTGQRPLRACCALAGCMRRRPSRPRSWLTYTCRGRSQGSCPQGRGPSRTCHSRTAASVAGGAARAQSVGAREAAAHAAGSTVVAPARRQLARRRQERRPRRVHVPPSLRRGSGPVLRLPARCRASRPGRATKAATCMAAGAVTQCNDAAPAPFCLAMGLERTMRCVCRGGPGMPDGVSEVPARPLLPRRTAASPAFPCPAGTFQDTAGRALCRPCTHHGGSFHTSSSPSTP
jgi:hypothetical protein